MTGEAARAVSPTTPSGPLEESRVLELFHTCSNAGRWGDDDELGTLNFITPAKRRAAFAKVSEGIPLSIGRDLCLVGGHSNPPSAMRVMGFGGVIATSSQEVLVLNQHGFEMTHLDALGHGIFQGHIYNERDAQDVVGLGGLSYASITGVSDGIVTRGVLLDVAASRGVEYLAQGEGIAAEDLEASERASGCRAETGDAVFVRSGHVLREEREGYQGDDIREGVRADVIPWLYEREIALYSGDCIEQMPSGYERVPMPLHSIGLVAMGLYIMDCPDVERLAQACHLYGRNDFLLTIAALRVPGGTGSPVNPIVVF